MREFFEYGLKLEVGWWDEEWTLIDFDEFYVFCKILLRIEPRMLLNYEIETQSQLIPI